MIFLCGIYFSFKLKFVHLNFKQMINEIKKKNGKDSISAFQSLAMSLAGKIGVGSLSGIALAIYLGGPGVLFWIWLTSVFCATNEFAESILAGVFRKKESGNIYRGGPFYYISEGLKNNKLAIIYALIVLVAYIAGFMTIQVNTVTKSITDVIDINPLIIGISIAVLATFTIFRWSKKYSISYRKISTINDTSLFCGLHLYYICK